MNGSANDRELRIEELFTLLDSHPFVRAQGDWNALARVYRAYQHSGDELLQLILAPSTDPGFAVEIMKQDQPLDHRKAYFDELFRLMHNYLSILTTLVDNSRSHVRRYLKDSYRDTYDQLVKAVRENESADFLPDLRNYLIHYRSPSIAISMSFTQGTNAIGFDVLIQSQALLDWDRWSAISTSILRSNDKVLLHPFITSYTASIADLYGWLFSQFKIIHRHDIEDFEVVRIELQSLLDSTNDTQTPHPEYPTKPVPQSDSGKRGHQPKTSVGMTPPRPTPPPPKKD